MDTSSFDILLLGATGFCGRLCTQYLASHPQRSTAFRLAIAARSKAKLAELVSELGLDDTVQVIQVDVTNFNELEAVVKRTKVVINTVGPFWRWGTPVVKACVQHGKHYVDLTGESPWIQQIIMLFDYNATKTGSIIVPSCGMDSVTSDLPVFLSNKTLKTFAGPAAAIDTSTSAYKMKGGISGGTLATVIASIEEVPPHIRKAALRDYSLSPIKGQPCSPPRLLYELPHSSPPITGGYFAMANVNKVLVQRTWALHELELRQFSRGTNIGTSTSGTALEQARNRSYGPQFKYEEFIATRTKLQAIILGVSMGLILLCLIYIPPIRWLAKRIVTKPGMGPSEEVMENGYLEVTNISSSVADANSSQIHVKSIMRGQGDPGYSLSSIMVSESALALLLDYDSLPSLGRQGGVLTSMSAMGDVLIERLKNTGRFKFESVVMGKDDNVKTR